MANKRIKISELPKVTYNPNAGALETTLSDENYLPIAVTDSTNAAIKTSMAVTTRELKRYIFNQPANFEDNNNELTIARTGITVKVPALSSSTFVTETASINTLNAVNFTTTQLTVDGNLKAGTSVYPSILRRQGQNNGEENLIIVSSANGVIDAKPGKTLQEFIAGNPVTSRPVAGQPTKVISIGSQGDMNFNQTIRDLIRSPNSVETNPVTNGGEILAVGTNGSVTPASTFPGKSLTNIDNTFNAIKTAGFEFTDATNTDQKLLVTTNTSPKLSGDGSATDIQVASTDHIKLTTQIDDANDAVNFISEETRLIANSPLVLAAKFENGQDLTVNTVSKDIPAQIGEIRWNIFNGIPTLYMAVSADNSTSGRVDKAKIWYGIPLFGDLASASISGNTDI